MKHVQTNDPRETPSSQTQTPWKDTPQRTTDPSQPKAPKPDLENWQESNTH